MRSDLPPSLDMAFEQKKHLKPENSKDIYSVSYPDIPKIDNKEKVNHKSGYGLGLRVRSNSGNIKRQLNAVESKILDDPNEPFDYFYKFIVIGDESTGKTNFMNRVCRGFF
jgi:hypothetical protein